jgi:hypothetical protein
MKQVVLNSSVVKLGKGKLKLVLQNPAGNPVAFFNRVALINDANGERILPSFFSDNYFSVLPGETKVVEVEIPEEFDAIKKSIQLYGWNVNEQKIFIH